MKKKIFSSFLTKTLLSSVALFSLTGSVIAGASWTVSQETVGPNGRWSTYGSPNRKKTNSNVASFNGDAMSGKGPYYVRLINSKAEHRSGQIKLEKNHTKYAGNNTGLSGYDYYADVRSASDEGKTTTVKLHFSSDRQ